MRLWTSYFRTAVAAFQAGCVPAVAGLALGGVLFGSAAADEAVFSNRTRFRIPYQLDDAEIKRIQAAEIQLHVTTDRGKNWRHVDSVPPVEGKFTFEASQDGEYWFSVRTVGKDGRNHPAGPLEAGLKVIVDTAPPSLSLQLSEIATGQVGVQWSASDNHLDVESLALEYRDSTADEWQTVQIVPTEAGETSWSVPQGGTIIVRGRVRDEAGNEASEQSDVTVSTQAAPQPQPPASNARRPIAEGQPPADETTTDPFVQTPTPAPKSPATLPLINPNGSEYSQFVSQQQPQPLQQPAPPQPSAPVQQPAAPQTAWSAIPERSAQQQAPTRQSQQNVRRVNATSFQIGYALDDVGPSGIGSVDLYLTEDGGRKWYHYGADEDGSSPFHVTVPQDGSYGFAIRVRSGVGLSQTPPQPGEKPEVTVIVDREPPQVTLSPLQQGQGEIPTQMQIEWTMTDEQLADRPVSLYFASRRSGPWQPITGWEPNSGRYVWTFGPDAPQQIYIRLEARDAAGNIARVESPEPLLIDLSRPTARIIDVESQASR